jgi:hypothetical protein
LLHTGSNQEEAMREAEMRASLAVICEELDRRARGVLLGCALGLAALGASACVEAPQSADARVQPSGDGRVVDLPAAVGMYSAPGCSWIPPGR